MTDDEEAVHVGVRVVNMTVTPTASSCQLPCDECETLTWFDTETCVEIRKEGFADSHIHWCEECAEKDQGGVVVQGAFTLGTLLRVMEYLDEQTKGTE